MEEKDSNKGADRQKKDRRRMGGWILAVVAVAAVYTAIELRDSWSSYEAGRERQRQEMRARTEAMVALGERYYEPELGLWITPAGHKHIKASTGIKPERVAAKEE
jgi:hypothetical protein